MLNLRGAPLPRRFHQRPKPRQPVVHRQVLVVAHLGKLEPHRHQREAVELEVTRRRSCQKNRLSRLAEKVQTCLVAVDDKAV